MKPKLQAKDAIRMAKLSLLSMLLLHATTRAHADAAQPGPQLLCHRTANEDVPENTLESLEQAALLGCNVVEIDLRRTLDGVIVLNHDGLLERLSDSTGKVEESYYPELALNDAGSWMGERFAGLRIARFEDALRIARTLNIDLVLDIKTPGIGEQVLAMLAREEMLEHVTFNGEWADVKKLRPQAHDAGDQTAWLRPPVTAEQVAQFHREGKRVVANFSDSRQEMDLDAMKSAVAAGVDAINVDYPRLGAEAVGRPVERTIADLIAQANRGEVSARSRAILQLARYRGFPLQEHFVHWLEDPEAQVSRAAALALLQPEYRPKANAFAPVLRASDATVRANAVWALGKLGSADALPGVLPLLTDSDANVRAEAYIAVSRLSGSIPPASLLRGLADPASAVRGAAALALARHPVKGAPVIIQRQLQREMESEGELYRAYTARQPKTLSKQEIARVTASYRCQMQMVRAIEQLSEAGATSALEQQAFRPGADFSQLNAIVAAFALWDRIGAAPPRAIEALGSSDPGVADRAEWMLIHAGPEALPAVRKALQDPNAATQIRAMRIVSMQGDTNSLPQLHALCDGPLAVQAQAAIARIELLQNK